MQRLFVIFILAPVFILGQVFIPSLARAECPNAKNDPYPNGLFASRLLEFSAGYWINYRGPLAQNEHTLREKKSLHSSRLIYPGRRVLGCPKATLEESLTLGHEGFVIVSPMECFRAGKGPDIVIHEPRSNMNLNEMINVYVTPDEKGRGPWYLIGKNLAVNKDTNYLELELEGVVNKRGYPITEFHWVKVEDANSRLVFSNERFSGFEVSAVKFMHSCNVPLS